MIVLNEEQAMLREMANGWVSDRAPVSDLRKLRSALAEQGYDPELYAEMAEMGWPAILVPEEFGGVGLDLTGLGLIVEELGRNLVASPLLGSAAGAVSALLLGTNEPAREQYLPQIADGSLACAIAVDDGNRHTAESPLTRATRDGDRWTINGSKRGVAEGAHAGLLVFTASLDDGKPAIFACAPDVAGITATRLSRIDSRGAADLTFDKLALEDSALLGSGTEYVDAVLDRMRAVLAAEMLGGAVQAFETTVEYMKTRIQFDHPIGSFQALQHRVAELLGELVLARAAVYGALQALDSGLADAARRASLAKATAGDTFRRIAREMIQLHGGIGMTDEHDAGLYLKRAHVADHTLGNVAFHRERYARLIGI